LLHGRKPFKENKDLVRELLRIRGSFFINSIKALKKTKDKSRQVVYIADK